MKLKQYLYKGTVLEKKTFSQKINLSMGMKNTHLFLVQKANFHRHLQTNAFYNFSTFLYWVGFRESFLLKQFIKSILRL